MASTKLMKRSRWAIDFTTRPKGLTERPKLDLPTPVGYSEQRNFPSEESHGSEQTKLLTKRSWNIALGPIKQVPMNLFIMYMAGNSISIFPIMIVGMMIFRSVKSILTLQSTFKMLEGEQAILQKIVFFLGNLAGLALALYKCHSMGLLPTAPSDWLAFKEHRQRVEYIVGGAML